MSWKRMMILSLVTMISAGVELAVIMELNLYSAPIRLVLWTIGGSFIMFLFSHCAILWREIAEKE